MSNWSDISFTPQGWQCPVCGAVYSPTTPMCYNCTGKTYTFSTTTDNSETKTVKPVKEDKPKYNPDYENWENEFRNG